MAVKSYSEFSDLKNMLPFLKINNYEKNISIWHAICFHNMKKTSKKYFYICFQICQGETKYQSMC